MTTPTKNQRAMSSGSTTAVMNVVPQKWRPPEQTNTETVQLNFALGAAWEVATHSELFDRVCRASVDLFRCDHSGLVLFNRNRTMGRVVAEYPDIGARGLEIPLAGVPFEESVASSTESRLINDLAMATGLGPVKELLTRLGITGLLVIPIVVDKKVVGSFSLDRLGNGRKLGPIQMRRAELLAETLATTLEKSQLNWELRGMHAAGLDLISIKNQQELLRTIIDHALKFVRVSDAGIYELSQNGELLTLVAASPSLSALEGTTLRVGDGLAGRLVAEEKEFEYIPDYQNWPHRAKVFEGFDPFESVAERRIHWQGQTSGILFVNDKAGRDYSEAERQSLDFLAEYAAVALHNERQTRRDSRRTRRLETLAETSTVLMEHVATDTRDELLDLVARYAAKIFEAETASVWLTSSRGQTIRLEGSVGHAKGKFDKGLELPIRAAERGGLTPYIAATGIPLNVKGDELRNHIALRPSGTYHTVSGQCEALLGFPLRRRLDGGLLGLIKLENRVDRNGAVIPNEGFSDEDELLASVFAGLAAAAIEESNDIRSARGAAEQASRVFREQVDSRTVFRRAFHHIKHLIINAQFAASGLFDWAENAKIPRTQRTQLDKAKNTLHAASAAITAYLNLISSSSHSEPNSVDVNETIRRTLAIFEYTLTNEGIETQLNLTDELPNVRATPLDLVEVLYSLISNAAISMKETSTKVLTFDTSLTNDGKWIAVSIADTGCGIPRENYDKIFAFGFSTRPGGAGNGLGLYGVRETVTVRFSGKIVLQQSRVGHGSTFQLLLKPDFDR